MPKLGSFAYPSVKLSRALQVVERISSDFKGHISVSGLATGLEMAEKGGGFVDLVAALRSYGLADGRKDLSITPLAESIIYSDSDGAAAKARTQAFFNVELFRKMWEKMGRDAPAEARLRAVLQEVTRESLTSINSRLSNIKMVWMDGVQLVDSMPDTTAADSDSSRRSTSLAPEQGERHDVGDFIEFKANGSYFRVRKSMSDVEFALKVLEVVKQELEVRQTGPTAPPTPSPPASS